MTVTATVERSTKPLSHRRLRRIAHHKDVAVHLVRLELARRHRGTFLGWVWSFTPPLLQLAATYFLFTKVIPLNVENYPLFLLVGILAWSWFSRSWSEATTCLENSRDLVLRPGFSTGLLPLTAVLVGLVDYLLAMPVLFIALALTTGVRPEAALLPVLLLIQFVFILGLGLLFAPLQVYLRDTRQFVTLAISIGFWLTPIFYRARQVPPEFQWILDANPMAYLIEAQRAILLEKTPVPGPAVMTMGWVTLAAVGTMMAGYLVFRAVRHSVPEQL